MDRLTYTAIVWHLDLEIGTPHQTSFTSSYQIMKWVRHMARIGKNRNSYRVAVGKLDRKRPLGRPKCRWEDIKMDPQGTQWEGMNWLHLAQDRKKYV